MENYVSCAIKNAIIDVNRKAATDYYAKGGNISLDQTNEQGEALSEAVADENASAIKKEQSKDLIGDYRKWKSTLNKKNQRILELSESGMAPSEIARAAGIGMTTEEVHARLKKLMAKAKDAGLVFSSKRGQAGVDEISIDSKNSQYQMPSPFEPKKLKKWLKEFYKQKEKPINKNTGWKISVPGTGIEETLNHLYRNRKNYRDDLHYLSLPYIDKMLEKAKFEKFDTVEDGKNADAISIFNVVLNFGEQGKYNARMVIKHFGEDKNFYDHKLTEFEELSDLELQPEGSGSLNNSSNSNNIPQSGEKSSDNLEFSNKRLHNQINPAVRDGVVRQEFADLLEKKEYTPETIAQWDKQAMAWILKQGGVYPAGQALLNDKAPAKEISALPSGQAGVLMLYLLTFCWIAVV